MAPRIAAMQQRSHEHGSPKPMHPHSSPRAHLHRQVGVPHDDVLPAGRVDRDGGACVRVGVCACMFGARSRAEWWSVDGPQREGRDCRTETLLLSPSLPLSSPLPPLNLTRADVELDVLGRVGVDRVDEAGAKRHGVARLAALLCCMRLRCAGRGKIEVQSREDLSEKSAQPKQRCGRRGRRGGAGQSGKAVRPKKGRPHVFFSGFLGSLLLSR